ncbi:MAG TPA: PaaI family thioesterase [Chloroflexota bacterium]
MQNGLASLRDFVTRLGRGEATPPPIAELIGFRPVSVDADQAVFEMDAEPSKHANPMGTVHGGVLATLADTAMGMVYAAQLEDGETFATLELKINFLRPVWQGRLVATARVVQAGRTVGLTECDVVDDAGKLVARASSTCMTLRGERGAGR